MLMKQKLVAVTGANGFIGGAMIATLRRRGIAVRALTRTQADEDSVAVGEIGPHTDWSRALKGVSHVIHTAARAHVIQGNSASALKSYREINVEGTRCLAQQALLAGVRRILFVSSIKVCGERTQSGAPFTARDHPAPEDAYGVSKWEAEQALASVTRGTDLEAVVVRPPLVYGPSVKGNIARLVSWVRSGIPLPLGAVRNRRSLVALDNLTDLLACCATHPSAAGKIFLAGDGEDLSTPELIRRIARAMNRPVRLISLPTNCLCIAAQLIGRGAEIDRLIGSLQVDIGPTCETLGWHPPLRIDEGLAKTVAVS